MCPSNHGSPAITIQVRNSVRPMHLFDHNRDHDYYFELLSVKRSGMPNQLLGVRLHTLAMYGLSRVRTELFHLLVIPSLAPHPVQTNGESSGHCDLGDLPSAPHRQVKILAAPFRVAAHRHLGCFHQQETQQRTPLLGDVSQPPPISARL